MSLAASDPGTTAGCVVQVSGGLVEVLSDRGRLWASWSGTALARLAADPTSRPVPGDRVTLTWWPDGPVTVDPAPGRGAGAGDGVVVPLRRRTA